MAFVVTKKEYDRMRRKVGREPRLQDWSDVQYEHYKSITTGDAKNGSLEVNKRLYRDVIDRLTADGCLVIKATEGDDHIRHYIYWGDDKTRREKKPYTPAIASDEFSPKGCCTIL